MKKQTDAERLAKARAQSKIRQEHYKTSEIDATSLRTFENQFDSETYALSPRGSLLIGSHIGNGGRWLRARRYS